MTFRECVLHCVENRELVSNFNRLYQCSIGVDSRSAIEKMVDQATGYQPECIKPGDAQKFILFVWECIWTRVPKGHTKQNSL